MPTYQYACTDADCGNRFELVQSFTDPTASQCPVCGQPVRKVFSAVGVVFKGSGFYRTDSRAAAGKGESKGDANGSGSSTKESKESKKEPAKESGATKSESKSGDSAGNSGSSGSSTGKSASSSSNGGKATVAS